MDTSNSQNTTIPEFISQQVARSRYFFFDLKTPPSKSMALVCGGIEHCLPGYQINREQFLYYSVEIVVGGEGVLTLDNHTHQLTPGCVYSYGPKTPHHIESSPRNPLIKWFIDITGKEADKKLRRAKLPTGTLRHIADPIILQDICEVLLRTALLPNRNNEPTCRQLFKALLKQIEQAPTQTNPLPSSPAYEAYLRANQNIQENLETLTTLQDIAKTSHLDPAYLCRLFKRFDQETPYQKLTRLKMNQAAAMMTATNLPIKAIASRIGIPDPALFSRRFKARYQLAPSAFRQRAQQPDSEPAPTKKKRKKKKKKK